jgi:hypothetical protein
VLGFRCAVGSRNPKIAFLAVVVDSINFSSFQRYCDVAASRLLRERPPTKIAMALQRAARAHLYKLLLAAAVQSRRPDLIECGNLPALALPGDKLALVTAQRRGRDRAPAPANAKQPGRHCDRVYVHKKYSKKYC